MNVPSPWYALAIVTTLLNGSTLGFIAWREHNTALRYWAAAWLAWGVAVIPLAALGSPEAHPLLAVSCGLLWVASTLCFLRGAYELAGKPTPRAWYAVAAACAVLALALGIGPAGPAGMVPLVLFQSVGLSSTGVVIIRGARVHTGSWLCGIALIALGLHMLDAPILAAHPGIFLWGFAVAIALQMLAALGMLMLYYEHARAQLLATERMLQDTRRIEALGRVAGGVAHDFNNMLMVVRANVDLMRARGDAPATMGRSLAAIDQALDQAARLTQQLLTFGRRSVVSPQVVDVRAVVAETLDLLGKVVPDRITLRLEAGDEPAVASLDRALLEQIVLNLVTNARDAIAGRGLIVVELGRRDLPRPSVVIRVIDDGAGMEETVVSRVFEPFFTSKPEGEGTGLGLASVQGAVSQLGGEITVQSAIGRGSTFQVVLPLAGPGGPADAMSRASTPAG